MIILMLLWLVGLSLFDIRYREVPVWLLVLGWTAVLAAGIYGCVFGESGVAESAGGMIPGLALLLIAAGTRKAGYADGIVLILLGSTLGFRKCILTAILSLFMISTWSILLLALKKADKRTRIPYIPFLTIGYVLCVTIGGLK